MSRSRNLAWPPLALLALVLAAFALAACGYESDEKEVVEGEPVALGELKYNVIFSRFLNPDDNEDSAYLVGQPTPPPGSAYFGVFFEVQNETDHTQVLPETLTIIDTEDNEYEVAESESIFAFPLGGEVEGEEQIPVLDSAAQLGPIEGSVAIFLLPDEASENRPLVLHIPPAEEGEEGGEVTLDL